MTMNYANAGPQNDFSELIPHGTLAHGLLRIQPFNRDQGMAETPSKSSDAKFLNCEVTITHGRYQGRKVFTRLGTAGKEAYVNMGRAAIKAILEFGRGANVQTNPAGYELASYFDLDNQGEGIQVGIKIKEEPGSEGYESKNDIACFLSPIPDSGTKKDFDRLIAGDTEPSEAAQRKAAGMVAKTGAAKPAASQPAWTQPAQGSPPGAAAPPAHSAAPPTPAARPAAPSWLTPAAQHVAVEHTDPPFN